MIAEILILLTIALSFIIMIKGRRNVKSDGVYQHPQRDEDVARIKQIKEWDRFDTSTKDRH